tara:strand:- start:2327 stop:3268 length:942 start_codon:yes stop_codon:yes gene_type:complete
MAEKINEIFTSFLNDIIKVFPEYEERLKQTYIESFQEEYDKSIISDKMESFLNNVIGISDSIVDLKYDVFSTDPIILDNISFKLLWNDERFTKNNKDSLWKYFQTFCIYSINKESNDKMDDVIKTINSNQKVTDKKTFKNMKKLKKLNEAIKSEKGVEESKESKESKEGQNTDDFHQIDDMFQNTSIGRIAKEITDELDIEKMVQEEGGIEQLFNGGNMMNIIQSISGKLQSDVGNNQQLMEEATQICGTMKDNPLFSSLMGMQSQMFAGVVPQEQEEVKNINVTPSSNHSASAKRLQLQKKLQEKKATNEGE